MSDITIGETFRIIVSDIKKGMNQEKLKAAVDVEINFESVDIQRRGLFVRSNETKTTKVKMATRILPDQEPT